MSEIILYLCVAVKKSITIDSYLIYMFQIE